MEHPTVFISYSHEDEVVKDRLLSHLGVLQRIGLIDLWSDDRIGAGDNWRQEISRAINQASIAILLVSAHFLTSAFILGQEVPALLKRRKSEGLRVFPVIVKACAWRTVPWLSEMNVRPKNGDPIWRNAGNHIDEGFAAIAEEVADVIESIIKEPPLTIIKVLIADDHIHEREGFKQLLSLVNYIEVIGEAMSAQECVYKALSLRPDVILLDLKWYKDRTAGISAIRQIKAQAPQIKILATTAHDELIEEARIAGADLAVDKDSLFDKQTLVNRIQDVYKFPGFDKPRPSLIESLSEREIEVLKLAAEGETDQGIASRLGISVSTTKKHISTSGRK